MTTKFFKTADEAVEQLLQEGFEKHEEYDPLYPYIIVWGDGDAVVAKVSYNHNLEKYYIEGVRL